jgi:dGTPase
LKLISQDCFRKAIDPGLLHWATDLDVRYKELVRWLFGPRSREGKRKWAINSLVNALIASIEIREFPEFDCPILRYRARLAEPALGFLNAIKNLIVDRIINSQEVQTLEFRGRKILAELFNALKSDPNSLLNEPFRKRLERLGRKQNKRRVLCDYIAGMTDVFATRFHARLFGTKQAWVFERL